MILRALEFYQCDAREEAEEALVTLLHHDLRHIEAHALLGEWSFDEFTLDASLAHFEVGLRIGEQALGPDFSGLLPWCHGGNRAFLRCLDGYGGALWRKKRFDEAKQVFEQLLYLDPTDPFGAVDQWQQVNAEREWREDDPAGACDSPHYV